MMSSRPARREALKRMQISDLCLMRNEGHGNLGSCRDHSQVLTCLTFGTDDSGGACANACMQDLHVVGWPFGCGGGIPR